MLLGSGVAGRLALMFLLHAAQKVAVFKMISIRGQGTQGKDFSVPDIFLRHFWVQNVEQNGKLFCLFFKINFLEPL